MPAADDFVANPINFMKNNVVFPGGAVPGRKVPTISGVYTVTLVANANLCAYAKKVKASNAIPYFNLVKANPGESSFQIYWVGYENNAAHGMAIGSSPGDPPFMFTVRMNSCTLGYAQASKDHPAYVSHHNAVNQGNTHDAIETQGISWDDGSVPNTNMSFAHREGYMKNTGNGMYGATTFGVRNNTGKWDFYFQRSKGHGFKHKELSLKGVTKIT